MNKRKLLSLAVLCSLLTSCVTNFNLDEVKEDSDLNTSLGFPIGAVHADMVNLLDLVNSEYVVVDSSNAVCIMYEDYLKLMPQVDTMTFNGKKLTQTINLNKEASFEAIAEIPNVGEAIALAVTEYFKDENSVYFTVSSKGKEYHKVYKDFKETVNWVLALYSSDVENPEEA